MSKLVVLDTETTDLNETAQVCEVGMVVRSLARPLLKWRWSSLVRPTVPIVPAARAAHHISDDELADKPTMEELLRERGLPELVPEPAEDGDVVLVAHNLDFDARIMRQSGVPDELMPTRRICTLKCARHLWPEVSGYSNQVLRYELGLEVERLEMPPHRALPDALVTAALLDRMLRERTVDQLVELTGQPVLQTVVRFGQHRGKRWRDVDPSYLRWILDPRRQPPFDDDVVYTARYHLENGGKR